MSKRSFPQVVGTIASFALLDVRYSWDDAKKMSMRRRCKAETSGVAADRARKLGLWLGRVC